jgi:hypothetical protein
VPAEQALVEQRGVVPGEGLEVGAVRVGGHVVSDDLDPGPRDRVMVLLRSPLVSGEVPDPVADPGGGLRHAVAPHGQEGQVDVLPVAELPAGAGDLGQDRGQFAAGRPGRDVCLMCGHQETSCKAVMTAW